MVQVTPPFAILSPLPFTGIPDQSALEDLESAMASITLVIDNVIAGTAAFMGDMLPVLPAPPLQPALRALGTRLPEPSKNRFVQHGSTPGKNKARNHTWPRIGCERTGGRAKREGSQEKAGRTKMGHLPMTLKRSLADKIACVRKELISNSIFQISNIGSKINLPGSRKEAMPGEW